MGLIIDQLHQLYSSFVRSSNSVLDGLLDGDVFFRNHSCLHPLTNFIQQCYECRVLNIVQHVINSSNAYAYPSFLLLLHIC